MFAYSGMNHFIGDWNFGSMPSDVGSRKIFFSMLGKNNYDDASDDEWQQFNNFITVVNSELCVQIIDSVLAELIVLATDKGMSKNDLDKLSNKIDDINQLMEEDDDEEEEEEEVRGVGGQ